MAHRTAAGVSRQQLAQLIHPPSVRGRNHHSDAGGDVCGGLAWVAVAQVLSCYGMLNEGAHMRTCVRVRTEDVPPPMPSVGGGGGGGGGGAEPPAPVRLVLAVEVQRAAALCAGATAEQSKIWGALRGGEGHELRVVLEEARRVDEAVSSPADAAAAAAAHEEAAAAAGGQSGGAVGSLSPSSDGRVMWQWRVVHQTEARSPTWHAGRPSGWRGCRFTVLLALNPHAAAAATSPWGGGRMRARDADPRVLRWRLRLCREYDNKPLGHGMELDADVLLSAARSTRPSSPSPSPSPSSSSSQQQQQQRQQRRRQRPPTPPGGGGGGEYLGQRIDIIPPQPGAAGLMSSLLCFSSSSAGSSTESVLDEGLDDTALDQGVSLLLTVHQLPPCRPPDHSDGGGGGGDGDGMVPQGVTEGAEVTPLAAAGAGGDATGRGRGSAGSSDASVIVQQSYALPRLRAGEQQPLPPPPSAPVANGSSSADAAMTRSLPDEEPGVIDLGSWYKPAYGASIV
jgi:hypothetical protein